MDKITLVGIVLVFIIVLIIIYGQLKTLEGMDEDINTDDTDGLMVDNNNMSSVFTSDNSTGVKLSTILIPDNCPSNKIRELVSNFASQLNNKYMVQNLNSINNNRGRIDNELDIVRLNDLSGNTTNMDTFENALIDFALNVKTLDSVVNYTLKKIKEIRKDSIPAPTRNNYAFDN